jgi:hypothetical protein
MLQPALASPPSSTAQDESFSSKGSRSIPKMADAAMVRRTRSPQQDYLASPVAVHMCTPATPRQGRAFSTPMAGVKGNALRLCLTNNIWTACRLLSVKVALATEVCQGHTQYTRIAKHQSLASTIKAPQYQEKLQQQSRKVSSLTPRTCVCMPYSTICFLLSSRFRH